MLFSSTIFLFIFFPIVFGIYFIALREHVRIQNIFLLIVSICFYAWGEPKFVFIMLISIGLNYFFARIIGIDSQGRKQKKTYWLALAILCNLGLLFIFKYLNFAISILNHLTGVIIPQASINLPIGISFFTFQAMSYVIDVYRGEVKVQKNILYIALYISFFPQLVAGPIVRYRDIEDRILNRNCSIEQISLGIKKFIIGLGKKVIISNQMAIVADAAFEAVKRGESISVLFAWAGAIAYTFQIYFDFDGYSQMAIGLGKMFGFDFPENFNFPYISKSISEFWRRWHISLSTWFRDYLYIPLGGNRVDSVGKHVRNLFIVWVATGVWHGANWTFILWGIIYFLLLVFEKYSPLFKKINQKPNIIQHLYTMFFVIMAWVLFRSDSILHAWRYMMQMFGKGGKLIDQYTIQYINEYRVFFFAALCYSLTLFTKIKDYLDKRTKVCVNIVSPLVYFIIFCISVVYLVTGGYNPFIYFNF